MKLRRLASLVIAALAVTAAPATARDGPAFEDVRCASPGAERSVVVLHAGSFVLGATAERLRELCRPWAEAGFEAVSVAYPTRNVPGAVADTRTAVRRLRREGHGPVHAYGESAGGTLAALLAVRGEVDAAVAVAAPTNLLTWARGNRSFWRTIGAGPIARRAASPALQITDPAPLTLLHSPDDEIVPFAQATDLARRVGDRAEIRRLTGRHMTDGSALSRAIELLSRR